MKADDRPSFGYPGDDHLAKRMTFLAQRQEAITETALEQSRTVTALLNAVEQAEQVADRQITLFRNSLPVGSRPVCAPGCCYCCKRAPEATIPEVIRVLHYVLDVFSAEEKAALTNRLDTYAEESAAFRPMHLDASRAACPFLVEGLCSIYPARPLSCRGLNSTDANVCREIADGVTPREKRPSLIPQFMVSSALRMGLRVGVMFEAADPAPVDLAYAAKLAWTEPEEAVAKSGRRSSSGLGTVSPDLPRGEGRYESEAGQNWGERLVIASKDYLEGKDHFIEARLPYDLDPFEPQRLVEAFVPAYRSERALKEPAGTQPDWQDPYFQFVERVMDGMPFFEALETYKGASVMHAIARINVPRVASSVEEILESRARFVQAMSDFRARDFDPAESFRAMNVHKTMTLAYQGMDDLEIMKEHGRLMVEGITSRCHPELTAPISRRKQSGKLRVGYLSSNLNNSNGGRWAQGWIKSHGEEIETFTLFVGSRADVLTKRFMLLSDHFYWLTRSVPESARFIRSLELDVLIFTDIGLNGLNTQYSALRLAPVQCTAWGHPVTSGLPTIDYYISSEMMEPENAQRFYSEKLVLLPRTGLCYEWPLTGAGKLGKTRSDFGLREDQPLIFMGQTNMKMLPQHDHLYAEICEKTKTPLVIIEGTSKCDHVILRKRLENAGVPTIWLPMLEGHDYLNLMKLADVSLDPPMWSGGNSTLQALALGTPVVTLPGPFMRSRHSYAMLKIAGAEGLIACDEKEYVELACDFDRQKQVMREADVMPLFEDIGAVKVLDEFLLSV